MEDAAIIKLYWDRDQSAISETDKKYRNYCYKIADNILRNNEDAEECLNDTYMNVWNSIPPDRPSVFRAFIGRITRNISFNRFKRRNAAKRGSGEFCIILDEIAECVSGKTNIENEFDRKEIIKAVNDFLVSLSAEKRNIFIRRYWYSENISDIAARYGMSEGAVSMSLSRIRKKLSEYLSERGFEL